MRRRRSNAINHLVCMPAGVRKKTTEAQTEALVAQAELDISSESSVISDSSVISSDSSAFFAQRKRG